MGEKVEKHKKMLGAGNVRISIRLVGLGVAGVYRRLLRILPTSGHYLD